MLIACVRILHFPIAVERRGRPDLAGRACLVAGAGPDGRRVVVDALDELTGVAAGMPLSQALSRAVEAVVIEADMPRYRAAFERLLDILQGVGPDVEAGDLGVAYLRLDGLTRLYGGLDGTLEATARVFPPSVTPLLGVGRGVRQACRSAARRCRRARAAPREPAACAVGDEAAPSALRPGDAGPDGGAAALGDAGAVRAGG